MVKNSRARERGKRRDKRQTELNDNETSNSSDCDVEKSDTVLDHNSKMALSRLGIKASQLHS